MATKTTKFITLRKLEKKDHIGTGDGGLISDKIGKRKRISRSAFKANVVPLAANNVAKKTVLEENAGNNERTSEE